MKLRRYRADTGEIFVPYQYGDGFFRVAHPKHGAVKHHAKYAILVAEEEELKGLVASGYSLRMIGLKTGQQNLISPKSIVIEK